jgi:hypothetical protein
VFVVSGVDIVFNVDIKDVVFRVRFGSLMVHGRWVRCLNRPVGGELW